MFYFTRYVSLITNVFINIMLNNKYYLYHHYDVKKHNFLQKKICTKIYENQKMNKFLIAKLAKFAF